METASWKKKEYTPPKTIQYALNLADAFVRFNRYNDALLILERKLPISQKHENDHTLNELILLKIKKVRRKSQKREKSLRIKALTMNNKTLRNIYSELDPLAKDNDQKKPANKSI